MCGDISNVLGIYSFQWKCCNEVWVCSCWLLTSYQRLFEAQRNIFVFQSSVELTVLNMLRASLSYSCCVRPWWFLLLHPWISYWMSHLQLWFPGAYLAWGSLQTHSHDSISHSKAALCAGKVQSTPHVEYQPLCRNALDMSIHKTDCGDVMNFPQVTTYLWILLFLYS